MGKVPSHELETERQREAERKGMRDGGVGEKRLTERPQHQRLSALGNRTEPEMYTGSTLPK